MAWNGSDNGKATSANSPSGRGARPACPHSRGLVKGSVTLALIALLGGAAIYFLMPGDAPVVAKEKTTKSGTITEVTPAPVAASQTTNAAQSKVSKPEEKKPLPPQRVGEIRDGYVLLPSGDLHRVKGIITNNVEESSLVGRTFHHFSDRMLGYLVMVKPGEGMLGSSEELYDGFDKEFVKSLDENIEDSKDDTDEQKALKDAVRDLRKELKQRMDSGEDINQVMIDARNQLKELALYRDELEAEVLNATSEDMSKEDFKDLVAAANKMLEERGSKPLELPSSLKYALYLKKLNQPQEQSDKVEEK